MRGIQEKIMNRAIVELDLMAAGAIRGLSAVVRKNGVISGRLF
jgi:hypothetical protein